MTSKQEISIFWFRRDLRIDDTAGLYHSLKNKENVLPLFIFDTDILDRLENKKDKRVEFIHLALLELQKTISESGSSLLVLKGNTLEIFSDLIKKYTVKNIYTNTDYEPSALERDFKIDALAKKKRHRFLLI